MDKHSSSSSSDKNEEFEEESLHEEVKQGHPVEHEVMSSTRKSV